MNRLPVTGTRQLLEVLDAHIPDDLINERWRMRSLRGPRWNFSAAQLWRVHLLALLTPVHSLNLLAQLLREHRAWRAFARLPRRHQVPDVRVLHAFRARMGVSGFRQINEALVEPLIQMACLWPNATALIDATDLPAACSGFKKKRLVRTAPGTRRQERARPKAVRVAGLWDIRNTASGCGGASIVVRLC